MELNKKNSELLKNSLLNSKCSRCCCIGLHACTGSPIVWTEDDKVRLKQALSDMFGWEKNGKND